MSRCIVVLAIRIPLTSSFVPNPAHAEGTGSLALTGDCVCHGSTQTSGDPALQDSFTWPGNSGFYGQVWRSNVEFASATSASSEFAVALGLSGALAEQRAIDTNLTHHRYPPSRSLAAARSDDALGVDAEKRVDDVNSDGPDEDCSHDLVSVVWAFAADQDAPVRQVRPGAHAADRRAERPLGDDFADSRIEAVLSATA